MYAEKRKNTALKVGGETMLQLLRGIQLDTLERIAHELRPIDFTNVDVIRAVDSVLKSRISVRDLEEGDTISMDLDDD